MADWVERLTSRFPLDGSPLYVVSDPDGLLRASHLQTALLARGLEIVPYEDPVIFRYQFEAEVRPRLQQGVTGGSSLMSAACRSGPFPTTS